VSWSDYDWFEKTGLIIMGVLIGILGLFLLCLVGAGIDAAVCGGDKPGAINEHPGLITNVSFVAAHEEKHCSKGCHYEQIPDLWYMRVCDNEYVQHQNEEDRWCKVFKVDHGPWDWQFSGARVMIISHQQACNRGWYYYSFKEIK
jgi:hypothetical protein